MPRRKLPAHPDDSVLLGRLARQLQRIAEARSLTLQELAETAGLSYSFLRAILGASQNVSVVAVEDIAKALGITVSELLLLELLPEAPQALPKARRGWAAHRRQRRKENERS